MPSPAGDPLDAQIDQAAASIQTVLIWRGDAAQRRSIAVTIHERSSRRANAFVQLDRGRLRRFLEAELRWQVANLEGATIHSRPRMLEIARGGTVFVDDLPNLGFAIQRMLCDACDSDSTASICNTVDADVRFVFGTGGDLPSLVREGRFREDLFRRITRDAVCLPSTDALTRLVPMELERKYLEFQNPFSCPKCALPARRFRQLRDGYLVCGSCGQSFIVTDA
jgi:DNA-binding NtrC family response regulator